MQGAESTDGRSLESSSVAENAHTRRQPQFAFAAADRLHRRAEFLNAQRAGARYQSAHFAVYARPGTGSGCVRLGITASRRIGNAVIRNRLKRRVRECFRIKLRALLAFAAAEPAGPDGIDVVVIARAGAGDLRAEAILTELTAAMLNLKHRLKAHQIRDSAETP
jgi:ribonuclease P protein component